MAQDTGAAILPAVEQTLHDAESCAQLGQFEQAAELYQTVLQAEPQNGCANFGLGRMAMELGHPEAALQYFGAALDAEPTSAAYWVAYIEALQRSGKGDEAMDVLALARQQGLAGNEVDALELRLLAALRPTGAAGGRVAGRGSRKAREPSVAELEQVARCYGQGRLADTATLALQLVRRYPRHWYGWKALGVVYQHTGRLGDALLPMKKATELNPGDAEAHTNLGLVQQGLGQLAEAESSYRRAVQLNPGYARASGNLGSVLRQAGRLEEAEAACRRATELDPASARAFSNLGSILQQLGRLDDAERACRRALELQPNNDEALNNLGMTLHDLGRSTEAEACYRRALVINPESSVTLSNLAIVDMDAGRYSEAEAGCRHALAIEPESVEVLNSLGVVLTQRGRLAEAAVHLQRAIELQPGYATAIVSLANVYLLLGQRELAADTFGKAIEISPGLAVAHIGLAVVCDELGRLAEAEASCRRAVALAPSNALAHSLLGCVMMQRQRIEEAEGCFRQALAIRPTWAGAHSNLLFCLSKNPAVTAATLRAEHFLFGERFEAGLRGSWPHHDNTRDPDRRLRIGFVSGDLRRHAIAYFIEPLLAELSRSQDVELYAYSNNVVEDDVTQRLRAWFARWQVVAGLTETELADRIREEGVDILIDLSGHTARNRLLTFARKPAPIQISWMGYPGTTGLTAVDYYLTDPFLLPPGRFDDQFTEKIVRVPAGAPFQPCPDAPSVAALPALANGYLTFGSFNHVNKIGPNVVALWSALLRALPTARLLIGGIPEISYSTALIEAFAGHGITPERLEFHVRSDIISYLHLHEKVDICLDTYPYNGGTTTLHALWMGVPTLSLAGNTVSARVGSCLLALTGLNGFIVEDEGAFVQRGGYWAQHLEELAEIRSGLRERFRQSAIGQPALVTAALERAFRIMWRRWCAGLPAEAFEVTPDDLASG